MTFFFCSRQEFLCTAKKANKSIVSNSYWRSLSAVVHNVQVTQSHGANGRRVGGGWVLCYFVSNQHLTQCSPNISPPPHRGWHSPCLQVWLLKNTTNNVTSKLHSGVEEVYPSPYLIPSDLQQCQPLRYYSLTTHTLRKVNNGGSQYVTCCICTSTNINKKLKHHSILYYKCNLCFLQPLPHGLLMYLLHMHFKEDCVLW